LTSEAGPKAGVLQVVVIESWSRD